MEKLRFMKRDELTNEKRRDLQNLWVSTRQALQTRTQGLTSVLRRSLSATSSFSDARFDSLSIRERAILDHHVGCQGSSESHLTSEDLVQPVARILSKSGDYGWGLSESTLTKAITELHEVPAARRENIQAVRDQISTRPEINFLRTDDAFLLRFLRARKFDVPSAFSLYCRYFEYRQRNSALFEHFDASEPGIKNALLDGFPGVLPTCDQYGHRVLIIFTVNWDHHRYGLISIYRALLLSLENLVDEEEVQINGFVLIVDWSGFTFRQSSQLNPRLLKMIIEGLQDCFPGRYAGVHFINQPWYVEAALTVIKPFLKDKAKGKIYLHGNNLTTLHNHLSRDMLPAELGGSGRPYNTELWAKHLIGDEAFPFSDRQIFWTNPDACKPLSSSQSEHSCAPQTEIEHKGRPSMTELDEEFFLSDG